MPKPWEITPLRAAGLFLAVGAVLFGIYRAMLLVAPAWVTIDRPQAFLYAPGHQHRPVSDEEANALEAMGLVRYDAGRSNEVAARYFVVEGVTGEQVTAGLDFVRGRRHTGAASGR